MSKKLFLPLVVTGYLYAAIAMFILLSPVPDWLAVISWLIGVAFAIMAWKAL